MNTPLAADRVLDGYRLVRFLGRGGFGEVWLCQSEAMGDYRALKWIPSTNPERLKKEYESLVHYRLAAARLRSPDLVPIEHVNREEAGLYYVMPLVDGAAGNDPADPAWHPLSLAAKIEAQAKLPDWFTSHEILALIQPVLRGLQTLSDAGLVHRDVKPENILFFNGLPCLGDISLLGADALVITRRGTPGYATPSWYEGGLPDMYGAAATLYTLLTGNLPDKMGRGAFLWPPQGEPSLSEAERAEWKRLHGVIRRATEERVSERFVDFRAMAESFVLPGDREPASSSRRYQLTAGILGLAIIAFVLWPSPSDQAPIPGGNPSPASGRDTANAPISQPASRSIEDANFAYNALSYFFGTDDSMTAEQNNFCQSALARIDGCLGNEESPDFAMAVRILDECLQTVPALAEIGNVRLSRLVFLQSAGANEAVQSGLNDPSLKTLGNDSLSYRVNLLVRLGAASAARQVLDDHIGSAATSPRQKSKALAVRARLSAAEAEYATAQEDADKALEAVANDPVERADREIELMGIEKDFPGYAEFLRSQPEK